MTARSLADRAGTSTTALYTHFDGMPGLWRAVRQEGSPGWPGGSQRSTRTGDPVADLAALGAVYQDSAPRDPFLYRAMFDAAADLEDPAAADSRLRRAGRVRRPGAHGRALRGGRGAGGRRDPLLVAGHGLAMLVLTGVLPAEAVAAHGPEFATALFVAAGDQPEPCRASVSGRVDAVGGAAGRPAG